PGGRGWGGEGSTSSARRGVSTISASTISAMTRRRSASSSSGKSARTPALRRRLDFNQTDPKCSLRCDNERRGCEMANRDLRDWIEGVRAAGELKVITGAEPKEEIGGIVAIYIGKIGNQAVLCDEVPGFPKGHRVIANILTSIPRVNLALGLPPETAEMEQIQWWRNYFKRAPSQPTKAVNGGPLLDNVFKGKDVDIEKIPTPVWHEHDGGPYIGTGCLVAVKDPDSRWSNYGTHRVQAHERNVASVMMSPRKHSLIIMRKYHERGEPCPVAVVAGMHPVLMMLGGIEIPYGKNELEAAGGILGEPVEVINMPKTGLPVPANAEIAFEGLIHPDDRIK